MAIGPGSRLGPYEVTALIGEGGMGKVWRAHHTGLKRDDALKVLPEAFASDQDRLARFRREAQVLASLNHPNIAHVHGLEQSDGVQALVMELVEGPTLADRTAQGPIPLDEALPIAKQIAEALEAAHEQNIIHRDLKPANIKVRPDGTVKVLDFGLAKALQPPSAAPGDVTASPTITSPAMMTGAGVILGTASYMSPEQARGGAADKRSDIWAFGCVLYEMLAGRRPFDGEDVSDTLANVLKIDPDWSGLPSEVPPALRTLLQSCLIKDRRRRVADISVALFVLDNAVGLAASENRAAPAGPTEAGYHVRKMWRRIAVAALAGAIIAGVAVGGGVWVATRPATPRQARFVLSSPSAPLAISDFEVDVAISPDGSRVAYISGAQRQIYVRAIDRLEATPLPGTDNAGSPFFSPDGNWVGFFQWLTGFPYIGNVQLRKTAILGGAPVTLAAVVGWPAGGSWGRDGRIVFATGTNLFRVPAAGGELDPLLTTDASADRFRLPEVLPGGRAVLFETRTNQNQQQNVMLLDLATREERLLIRGGSTPRYSPTGHIVYGRQGTLLAVPFDLDQLSVGGDPVSALEGVMVRGPATSANFSLAADGSLVYVAGGPGGDLGAQRTIVRVDRQGRETPLAGIAPGAYRDVRISPDGARVAVSTPNDVFTYDVGRATLTRLTTHGAMDSRPLWTRDGDRIVFSSDRSNFMELFWRRADGSGDEERVLTRGKNVLDLFANGWSPDGSQILFTEVSPLIQCAIGQVATTGGAEPTTLVRNEFCNLYAAVSQDGRWLAYSSTLSGRQEIYVERYPELRDRQQISTNGGGLPLWSRDGRELFFSSLDGRQMLAVPVRSGTTLVAGRPELLFEGPYAVANYGSWPYDLFPDGRLVMINLGGAPSGTTSAPNLIVVQNWAEELKRLVPTN